MNEKDKEAFEKWCTEKFNIAPELVEEFKHTFIHKLRHTEEAWQSACEYKQKEIDELEAENAKLKECVEFYADFNSYGTTKNVRPRIPWEKRLISAFDVDDSLDGCFPCGGKRARQVLKELEEK